MENRYLITTGRELPFGLLTLGDNDKAAGRVLCYHQVKLLIAQESTYCMHLETFQLYNR